MAVYSIVSSGELNNTARWDAEFYQPSFRTLAKRLKDAKAVPLGRFVAQAKRGLGPDYNEDGKIPVIRTVNVRNLEISGERLEYVTEAFFKNNPRGQVTAGEIIVTSTGIGTLGRVFCNYYDRSYLADGHITILKLHDKAQLPLITAILQSSIGAQQFEQRQRGSSGQIEIYPEDILNVLVPQLSPKVAKAVAKKWIEAISLIENSKCLYPEAESELLERIGYQEVNKQPSELYYPVDSEVLNKRERLDPEHYQPKFDRLFKRLKQIGSCQIEYLVSSIDKGTQPDEYVEGGEVIVVKSKNVFGQGIELTKCERTGLKVLADETSRLRENDVVINSTGLGTLGRAGVVHCDGQMIVASVDLLILRTKSELIDPDYLSLFLNSPAGIAQSEQYQTGSSGQLHLYPDHVRQFMVFIPKIKNGKVDLAWQHTLGDKVRISAGAKFEACVKLEEAKRLVEESIK
jgi:type I restriction enzyme S subunit